MLELDVMPERGLCSGQWELTLGTPLVQVISILQSQYIVIDRVQLSYSAKKPLEQDIILDLINNGIRLVFDSLHQRLKVIDVYDIRKVKLKYCNNIFSAPGMTPTLELIRHCFGPTRAGQRDVKQQLYLLLFRGIVFVFPLWTAGDTTQPMFSSDGLEFIEPKMESSLVLSKMRIYSGNNPFKDVLPSIPLECYQQHSYADKVEGIRRKKRQQPKAKAQGEEEVKSEVKGEDAVEEVEVKLEQNLAKEVEEMEEEEELITRLNVSLRMYDREAQWSSTSSNYVSERIVSVGDSTQDIQTELGYPNAVFYKDEDKTRIHSPSPDKLKASYHTDYFYNYFILGLDFLFDGHTHRVKKIILHTNYPGHFDFNIYHRCNFILPFTVNSRHQSESSVITVTPYTKWSEVHEHLVSPAEKPVVLSRCSSTNSTNPFGHTFCYCYQNVIFEVMGNGYIASVTIYDPNHR